MITFQTDSVLYITSGTNHGNAVITKPAGTVEGDLLIWFGNEDRSSSRTWISALPAGWTAIDERFSPGRFEAGAAAFKIAGPSEPATYTFQILSSVASASASVMLRFSTDVGFDIADVIHAVAVTGLFQIPGAPPVDWICPSATVAKVGTRVIRMASCRFGPNLWNDGVYSLVAGPAATEIVDRGSGDVTNRSGFGAYLENASPAVGPTGPATIRWGAAFGVTGYEAWSYTIVLAETQPDFQDMPEAEARARDLVADGTWPNAHSQRTFLGAPATRFQRFMSPAAPDEGGWVETTDAGVT